MKLSEKTIKISGGTKFLLAVLLLYLIIALLDLSLAGEALWEFFLILGKVLPLLGIVFVMMVLVHLYFDKKKIGRYLGIEAGVKGWLYAMISGIVVSGPPYVLFPLLGKLKKEGMRDSLLAVFLYNRNVKISFWPAMIYYFGFTFTLILSLYIIIFSFLNGWLIGWFLKKH